MLALKIGLLIMVVAIWWFMRHGAEARRTFFPEGFRGAETEDAGGSWAVDGNDIPGPRKRVIYTNDVERAEFTFTADATAPHTSRIPNVIWMFWEGPMNSVVEYCIDSWKHYHPDYRVVVLNKTNCADYLDMDIHGLRHANESITRFADFLRCLVLSKYGGFWVDASIICHAPLTWVHAVQRTFGVETVGYYHGSTSDLLLSYSPIIENWFFACVPGSAFMHDWCAEFLRFNEYETVEQYLVSLRDEDKVQFVNLHYLEYLTMHASAQKVFQTHRDAYHIYLFCANCGPFRYLDEVGWGDTKRAVDLITDPATRLNYQKYTMVKLCNDQRREMITRDDATIRRAFSHL
jgi:hypothetical protein